MWSSQPGFFRGLPCLARNPGSHQRCTRTNRELLLAPFNMIFSTWFARRVHHVGRARTSARRQARGHFFPENARTVRQSTPGTTDRLLFDIRVTPSSTVSKREWVHRTWLPSEEQSISGGPRFLDQSLFSRRTFPSLQQYGRGEYHLEFSVPGGDRAGWASGEKRRGLTTSEPPEEPWDGTAAAHTCARTVASIPQISRCRRGAARLL